VKRYDLGCWTIDGEIVPMAEGDYVLYADHLADRASLLATLRQAVETMEAYKSLLACYRLGTRPSERLFAKLEKSDENLAACREKLEEKV